MSWTDNDIEKMVRKAAEQKSVPFKDAYWTEMEAMLNQNSSKRRAGFWWIFPSAIALTAIIAAGIYTYNNNAKATLLAENKDVNTTRLANSTQLQATTKNQKVNTASDSSLNSSKNTSDSSDQIQHASMNGNEVLPSSVMSSKNKNASSATNNFNKEANRNIKNTTENTQKSTSNKQATDNQNTVSAKLAMQLGELKNSTQKDKLSRTEQTQLAVSNLEKIAIDQTNLNQLNDESSRAMTSINTPSINVNSIKKLNWYVGLNMGAGNSYISDPSALLIQWNLKAGLDYRLPRKFTIGVGFGFRQQFVNNLQISRSRTYYSTDQLTLVQSITYDRLHFVDLNLHVNYEFNKIQIGLQLRPTYLLYTRAVVNQNVDTEDLSLIQPLLGSNKQFVQTDNLKTLGFEAGLTFQYMFKPKFAIEVGAYSRMNEFINSPEIIGERATFPVRFDLGIIKRF